jgi:hypothetical protein
MQNNYTRQRQGRDFSLLDEINHLRNAEMSAEGKSVPPRNKVSWGESYNQIDGILGNAPKKDDYEAKTLLEQIEYSKAVSERNAAPVDGKEPSQERSAPERMR